MNIVKLLVDRGANGFNRALSSACSSNNADCIQFLIDKGANNWDDGLMTAFKAKAVSAIVIMIKNGAKLTKNSYKYLKNPIKKSALVENLYRYFKYPADRHALVQFIDNGISNQILNKVPKIDKLYAEIELRRSCIAIMMHDTLLNELIGIVISYVTL